MRLWSGQLRPSACRRVQAVDSRFQRPRQDIQIHRNESGLLPVTWDLSVTAFLPRRDILSTLRCVQSRDYAIAELEVQSSLTAGASSSRSLVVLCRSCVVECGFSMLDLSVFVDVRLSCYGPMIMKHWTGSGRSRHALRKTGWN